MRRALVIGCSEDVWKHVRAAQELCTFDKFYLVKLAGVHWLGPPFTWVTLHPEFMAKYKQERAGRGLHSDYEVVAPLTTEVGMHFRHPCDRRISYRWPGMTSSGSSGLFGVKVAFEDKCSRIVLAGIPMSTKAGHFTRKKHWEHCVSFIAGWRAAMPFIRDTVRSVSGGWTEETLGRPTEEWLGVSPGKASGATPELNAARG